jgi:hypothetical protein
MAIGCHSSVGDAGVGGLAQCAADAVRLVVSSPKSATAAEWATALLLFGAAILAVRLIGGLLTPRAKQR